MTRASRRRRLLALMAVFGLLLAACGGGDDDGNGAGQNGGGAGASEGDIDPNGTARLGYDLLSAGRGGFSWNPLEQKTGTTDMGLYHWVYGGLMRPTSDGSLEPFLAERAEVVDDTTIEVQLRDGLTLSDGRPVNAEMYKELLDRNMAASEEALSFGRSWPSLTSVEVTSPTEFTLTIADGTAYGWFDRHIAAVETVLVPPDTDFSNPVGAGPYRVVSYSPEQSITLEKNPEFFDPDAVDVARIELINVSPSGTAAPASISAGQVDFVRLSEQNMVQAVTGDIEILTSADPYGLATMLICKDRSPLDDKRVRQALAYGIDREAINDAVYDGDGQPAWDMWPEGHRFYNEDWEEHYAFDPDRARELLEEAGYADGFTIDFMPHPTTSTHGEIIQQSWEQIGVTANLMPTSNYTQDALIDVRAPLTMVPVNPAEGGRIAHWSGDALANICEYNHPEMDRMVEELSAVSANSQEAVDIWQEISDFANEEVLSIFTTFQPRWNAYDPEVLGGVQIAPYTIVVPDMWELYVKA